MVHVPSRTQVDGTEAPEPGVVDDGDPDLRLLGKAGDFFRSVLIVASCLRHLQAGQTPQVEQMNVGEFVNGADVIQRHAGTLVVLADEERHLVLLLVNVGGALRDLPQQHSSLHYQGKRKDQDQHGQSNVAWHKPSGQGTERRPMRNHQGKLGRKHHQAQRRQVAVIAIK